MKTRILFVCLGNICRSPMAEAVLRRMAADEGMSERLEIDSAGTGDWHIGKPPHEGTRKLLDGKGISYEGMRARQFITEDFRDFDYIICMDTANERDVRALRASNDGAQVMKFMELVEGSSTADVPDPYYTGNFDEVYSLVEAGCRALLNRIKAER